LIVSREVEDEYVEVLRRVNVAENRLRRFRQRLEQRGTVTHVKLGPRPRASVDPDDNVVLATALVGKAQYVITNDPDLLDIAAEQTKRFRFSILTPAAFLDELRRSEQRS
jgi:putative PIN family toxin of toxin-antitoxin system